MTATRVNVAEIISTDGNFAGILTKHENVEAFLRNFCAGKAFQFD